MQLLRLCVFILALTGSFSIWAKAPALSEHPSPYIRLHANDAVHWQVWQPSILQQARQQNKLIFISVGYFSCHWCHVMRNESFNDADVAKLLNKYFISVKVDRELNPALDQQLMSFLQQSRGYGGWPLNVFVTPEGYPLYGLVYLAKDSFIQLLENVSGEWKADQAKLEKLALEAFQFSRRLSQRTEPLPEVDDMLSRLFNRLRMTADELQGGIGNSKKFPREALLLALLELELEQKRSDAGLREWLQLTLEQMMNRGLHDVVGGGFFRYTVDPGWHTPHFEKMLYTNAAMIELYVSAYRVFQQSDYLDLAKETADFIFREMAMDGGGYVSALSAQDQQGREGGSYLWSRQSLAEGLSQAQWKMINQHWLLTEIDDGVLPTGLALGKEWSDIRQHLLKKRQLNPSPMDDKVLPSWNGYLLSALAALINATEDKKYQEKGQALYLYLKKEMDRGLARESAWGTNRYLEDFAFVAQGMLDWETRVLMQKPSKQINDRVVEAVDLFIGQSGWQLADTGLLPMVSEPLNIADAQLPSPEVVLKRLIRQLSLQDNEQIKRKLSVVSTRVDSEIRANILHYASHVIYLMKNENAASSQ
ncbi:MAG: thioredoxin domain-containing protein [Gammaproteobacteria bacterium]